MLYYYLLVSVTDAVGMGGWIIRVHFVILLKNLALVPNCNL